MASTFHRAVELASRLPKKDQEALGTLLLEEMKSEKRWEALFDKSQSKLSDLASQALESHKAGKTKRWK